MPDLKRASSKRRRSGSRKLSEALSPGHLKDEVDAESFERDWGISPKREEELLEQFRALLKEEGLLTPISDKYRLRRFLRARQHDLKRARAMWADDVKWRKEFGADSILENFHFHERDAFISVYPQGYHKTDKMGRPIYIQHMGQINVKKIQELTTDERTLRFHVQEYERCDRYIMPACSKAAGRHIDQTLAIVDVKGVGLKHLTGEVKKLMGKILAIDQNHYPEMLGHTCIINAPGLFKLVFGAVKPMLDARTQAKIELTGTNYLPSLLQWVDRENLPEYLGGTSTGTLLDDAGPWQDPAVVAEIDAERAQRGEQHQAAVEEEPHEDGDEDDGARAASRQRTASPTQQSPPAQRGDGEFRDAVPNLRRLSSSATSVGEDGYYSAAEEDLSFTSSPGREEGSEKLVEMAHNPMGDHSGSHQVAISARVKALEDAIPAHQQRLGLKGGVSHSAEDLGMRVDRLEEAMKALLTAQTEGDSGLHRRTNSERMPPSPFSASSQKAEQQPKCCGCVVQ